MRTVYALFVGIDRYPVDRPLRGCVNDVEAAEDWLVRQPEVRPAIMRLRDAEATREAVADGIRGHLGGAGPGDTALFWYSGHGSEQPAARPGSSTGLSEALVCHDSLGAGGQPLYDSELGPMLDEIAARGVHVVAVLDCCHSGGATRGKDRDPERGEDEGATRGIDWRPWWRPEAVAGHLSPDPRRAVSSGAFSRESGFRDTGAGREPGHVLVAACRARELAYEEVIDGVDRGCFSHALLRALDRLGPAATYGAAHALAEEDVRSRRTGQRPGFRGPATGRFLHGETSGTTPFLLRLTTEGWEVNCGAAHGLRAPGGEFALLRPGAAARRAVTVTEVRTESSLVEPVGWWPAPGERDTAHEVTPSALAFSPAEVSVSGTPQELRLVADAVAASPLLTLAALGRPLTGAGPALRVKVVDGMAEVCGGAGRRLPLLPLSTPADARRIATCCAHIARWHQLYDLANPDVSLSSRVRVTVAPLVGDLRHTGTGDVVCEYTADGQEPQVRVRIHNDSPHELWCVLLDLTDGYACSPHLFDGDFIGPGRAGEARQGEPVWLRLPPERELSRGAFTDDVLKVIVAERELDIESFRLPAWTPGLPDRGPESPGAGAVPLMPVPKDAGGPSAVPSRGTARWGTASVAIRTQVPGPRP